MWLANSWQALAAHHTQPTSAVRRPTSDADDLAALRLELQALRDEVAWLRAMIPAKQPLHEEAVVYIPKITQQASVQNQQVEPEVPKLHTDGADSVRESSDAATAQGAAPFEDAAMQEADARGPGFKPLGLFECSVWSWEKPLGKDAERLDEIRQQQAQPGDALAAAGGGLAQVDLRSAAANSVQEPGVKPRGLFEGVPWSWDKPLRKDDRHKSGKDEATRSADEIKSQLLYRRMRRLYSVLMSCLALRDAWELAGTEDRH